MKKIGDIGWKKLHESVGKASYILHESVWDNDGHVKRVEAKRVDLEIDSATRLGRLTVMKPESSCPYGGKKCSAPLYSYELRWFYKKLAKMRRIWLVDTFKKAIKRRFWRIFR